MRSFIATVSLIVLLILLVSVVGCLGTQIYDAFAGAAGSTKQSLQNFDENSCCKNSWRTAPGCICPEPTIPAINITPTTIEK
jgi:hypothetical protein